MTQAPAAPKPPFLEPFPIAPTLRNAADQQPDTADHLSPDAVLALIQTSLDDDKAEDLLTIPLAGKTDIADYMVIASGRSTTHVKAMADHLLIKLKRAGAPAMTSAGEAQGDWVAIDAIDVIVHLFRPEVRAFYQLEKMWQGEFSSSQNVKLVAVS